MRLRLPLYAKILFWFFLNVVILGILFAVAWFHFRIGLDSLVSGPAGERLQTVIQLLAPELNERPRNEWDDVLKKYDAAYNVSFHLFQNEAGELNQIGGEPVTLPAKVRDTMLERRGVFPPVGRRGGPLGRGQGQGFDGPPEDGGPPPQGQGFQAPLRRGGPGAGLPGGGPGNAPRFMVHTSSPGRYWVLVPLRVRGPVPGNFPPDQQGGPQGGPPPGAPGGGLPLGSPAMLVIQSATLSAGGLFFDATPWVVAAVAVVAVSALFWFPLVRGITRSISQMTRATERMAEGEFGMRTDVARQDELGTLSEAIDRMGTRLAGFVTGQKRFLGDIAHELCSPIARMQVALGILEHKLGEADAARLDDLREEVQEMSSLVNELLSFSRASLGSGNTRLQPVLLRGIVEKAVARECGEGDGVTVQNTVPEGLRVTAEPDLLLRAVANVVRNAIRYAALAGPIAISAAAEGDAVVLRVEDCGPGIPADALARVFDPFYRVDSSRTRETGGVGLGLSIVKTCVESCKGTVSCENREPSGLRVNVRLSKAD